MEILRVSTLTYPQTKSLQAESSLLFVCGINFAFIDDDEKFDHICRFYIQNTTSNYFELCYQDDATGDTDKLFNVLSCEINKGTYEDIAKVMLNIFMYREKTEDALLISDYTEIEMVEPGLINADDLTALISSNDEMAKYLSDDYKLYGVFYDDDSRPGGQIEVNVYGFENAVKTADSLDAKGVYFSCYDDECGLLYFKHGNEWIGER